MKNRTPRTVILRPARPDPLRTDPTRTAFLRRSLSAELGRVFARLGRGAVSSPTFHPPAPVQNKAYDYATTQFDVTNPEVVALHKRVIDRIAPGDILKIEDTPHITVRYGLHDEPSMPGRVELLAAARGPVVARLGDLTHFELPDRDVLKFDVESQQLENLNRSLGLLPHTQTHPDYHPHMTVAYLKPGTASKYVTKASGVSLKGHALTFTELIYSSPDEQRSRIVVNCGGVGGKPGPCPSGKISDAGRSILVTVAAVRDREGKAMLENGHLKPTEWVSAYRLNRVHKVQYRQLDALVREGHLEHKGEGSAAEVRIPPGHWASHLPDWAPAHWGKHETANSLSSPEKVVAALGERFWRPFIEKAWETGAGRAYDHSAQPFAQSNEAVPFDARGQYVMLLRSQAQVREVVESRIHEVVARVRRAAFSVPDPTLLRVQVETIGRLAIVSAAKVGMSNS